MKVLSVLALASFAGASLFNTNFFKYSTSAGACVLQPGYVLFGAANDGADPVNPPSTALEVNTTATTDGAQCQGAAASTAIYGIGCVDGWVASGTWPAARNNNSDAWDLNVSGFTMFTAEDLGTTNFTCTVPTCTVTCTGTGCTAASSTLANGSSIESGNVCNAGWFTTSTDTCTSDGTTFAITCTMNPAGFSTYDGYATGANASGASYSLFTGGACTCRTDQPVNCPNTTANGTQPLCTNCLVPTNPPCTANRQALVGVVGVTCPTATTLAQAQACFKAASCARIINPTQTCVYTLAGTTTVLNEPCPSCDSSKKGLLGLLGLLGLIPLLLCSLLCCLLLLCRRNKKGAPQHIGTFEQPAVCDVPVPVTHQFVTAHTTTHVGGPAGPVMGPTVF